MSYIRVIPRDLFNEAKLLKCIGRLVIVNEETDQSNMSVQHDDKAFDIRQNQSDGSLYINNMIFKKGAKEIHFSCAYNNRRNYPLQYYYEDQEDFVFDDKGEFFEEFKTFIQSL